jgi:hypothetical protein
MPILKHQLAASRIRPPVRGAVKPAGTTSVRTTWDLSYLGFPVYNTTQTTDSFYADAPLGGSYDEILRYAHLRHLPTLGIFASKPSDFVLIFAGFFDLELLLLPVGFVYSPNAWEGVLLSIALVADVTPGPPATPVPGATGPLSLLSFPGYHTHSDALMAFMPPRWVNGLSNPLLTQVSFGRVPIFETDGSSLVVGMMSVL